MNEILKALQNRKMEVELKSEKVELSSLAQLKKSIAISNKIESDGSDLEEKQTKAYREFFNISKTLLSYGKAKISELKEVRKDISSFEKQAKDLGLKPESVKEYNEAISSYKRALSTAETVKDLGTVKNPF